ncbi:MAG: hypothetical protein KKA73_02840 [Chloroflexi bacterium]|nr:hypothetical protein [Chloroflexota bacterium]MBU1746601.1 hypothetical protein [Chloroflexota bacterium]
MNNHRTFVRVPALVAAIVVALLLLAGTYTVIASPAPAVMPDLPGDSTNATSWSSGWQPIAAGTTRVFNHNLGVDPDNYAVEVWFQETDPNVGINRIAYGGVDANGNMIGAYWDHLTSNTISVHRNVQDTAVDSVLARVWIVPPAVPPTGYDSGWTTISTGIYTFTHGLNITATDLTVGLWFSSTARGIHHFAYGGLSVNGPQLNLGAHWHNLTDNTVQVTRLADDTDVEQVRVIVVQGDAPDYDSLVDLGDWQFIAPNHSFTFTHNLGWNPNMLLVRGECYDPVTAGINQVWAGGNVQLWGPNPGGKGAHIYGLTADSVTARRWAVDDVCPEMRIRIWRRSVQIYLPLTLRNY